MAADKCEAELFRQLRQMGADFPLNPAGVRHDTVGRDLAAVRLDKVDVRLRIQAEVEDVRLPQLLFPGDAVDCPAFQGHFQDGRVAVHPADAAFAVLLKGFGQGAADQAKPNDHHVLFHESIRLFPQKRRLPALEKLQEQLANGAFAAVVRCCTALV